MNSCMIEHKGTTSFRKIKRKFQKRKVQRETQRKIMKK